MPRAAALRVLDNQDPADLSASKASGPAPPYEKRIRLDNIDRVRRELTALFVEGKRGRRDVTDVSKLANVLGLMGRLLEGGETSRRLDQLEAKVERIIQR